MTKEELLFQGAIEGNIETIKKAIALGVDIQATISSMFRRDKHSMGNSGGYTALHWAVRNGHEEAVEYLIQAGADVNVLNQGNNAPLHMAIFYLKGKPRRWMVQMLIRHGASLDKNPPVNKLYKAFSFFAPYESPLEYFLKYANTSDPDYQATKQLLEGIVLTATESIQTTTKENQPATLDTATSLASRLSDRPVGTDNHGKDAKDQLAKDFFLDIVKKLQELNLGASSPSIFLIYAHDAKSGVSASASASGTPAVSAQANAKVAKKLIGLLHGKLGLNLYSDIKPFGNHQPASQEDLERESNILKSQLCLLPDHRQSIEHVILCGSELLGEFERSSLYNEYFQAISQAYSTQVGKDLKFIYSILLPTVTRYTRNTEREFHHLLTELVFLNFRLANPNFGNSIVSLLLNGHRSSALPSYISGIDVYIGESRWREHKEWKGKVVYKNEGLHLAFFSLLKRLYADKPERATIEIYEERYKEVIKLIRKDKFSPEQTASMLDLSRQLKKESEEREIQGHYRFFTEMTTARYASRVSTNVSAPEPVPVTASASTTESKPIEQRTTLPKILSPLTLPLVPSEPISSRLDREEKAKAVTHEKIISHADISDGPAVAVVDGVLPGESTRTRIEYTKAKTGAFAMTFAGGSKGEATQNVLKVIMGGEKEKKAPSAL